MPLRYVCSKCNTVLYHYDGKKHLLYNAVLDKYIGVLTPREASNIYNGKCPVCGKKLEIPEARDWKPKVSVKR